MARWVDRLISAVLVVAGFVFGAVLWQQSSARQPLAAETRSTAKASSDEPAYMVGERLRLEGIDFSRASKTLVVFLSSSCQYCIDSIPFYRKLTHDRSHAAGQFQLVIVGIESSERMTGLLRTYQLSADQLVSAPRRTLRVGAIPTVILTDRRATIRRIWVGQQPGPRQAAILGILRSGNLSAN